MLVAWKNLVQECLELRKMPSQQCQEALVQGAEMVQVAELAQQAELAQWSFSQAQ